MARTPSPALAVAALVVCSAFGGVAVGAIPDNRVTITQTTVAPTTPTAGAPTTVSATVRLSGGSASAASLDRVAIVDGDETLGEATGLGALSPGETLTVPVTTRFEEPGARNLTIVATVTDADGERTTVRRPLSLVVESGAPQVAFETDGLAAGADVGATVTVSNPTTAALRDLTLSFPGVDGERTSRTIPTLAAGASQSLNFSLRAVSAGERPLRVEVSYTTAAGTRATTVGERVVTIEGLDDDVGIRVERVQTSGDATTTGGDGLSGLAGALGGGGGTLQSSGDADGEGQQRAGAGVTVTNFGNAAIERVVLVPRLPNGSVAPQLGRVVVAETLAPGESEQVVLDLSAVQSPELRFAVEYGLGSERREAVQSYRLDRDRGAVSLTGLNVTVDGDRVRLSGNLGNVGDGEARGVVVRVGTGEYAAPAYPQRDYFLGTVAASEFAPFELTARVDVTNATSIPVVVSYTTADERRTETVEVPLPRDVGDSNPRDLFGSLGGTVVGGALGLLVTVPVVGFAVRRYR
ncbi:MAG: hypothetical protein V5A38_06360 [Halolamina sp.]|uniref:hypothetical protein n=1 Tax=Halolamina sp. TaxID=1940283 RepID=UPI002FC2AFA9